MDAAAKPPRTGLRRLPQPDPPRHPTDCPLLTLTLIRQVQGAALPTNPLLRRFVARATLDPPLH
ncbi:hypothetical protein B9Y85_06275 [Stenotrophomonas maltophilia]|uniref:Uncharacterized protein n=1 Tax=Stenotrophomonas maltophilia TaxID=40324 RepID=A0A2J0SYF1_STEMA|nr:hypothetical protein [Stenotrophomonas maltophilia]PJL03149.1 hypothetical protein B9Y57_04320 [Stenotrophomonas maltophilia]PJL29747.1 hypothetical protein B9Y65_04320 [Stenotrophomonas maltophilia]PJL70103.1 hypothetical protein B9Y85_06275 [Stenotrophomonas maltophilia]